MKPSLSYLVSRVESLQAKSAAPAVTIDVLTAMHGARVRYITGTYELRMGGVAGTSTSGGDKELLDSWLRAARRKLERSAAK